MSRLEQAARVTYGRLLHPDEVVLATVDALAAGIGGIIGYGAIAGSLGGTLAWTLLDPAGLLPLAVLGAFVGIVAATWIAARRVRAPQGPGALMMVVALTNERLLLARSRAGVKMSPVRSYSFDEIESLESRQAAIGDFRQIEIHLASNDTVRLLARGGHDVERLVREYRTTTS